MAKCQCGDGGSGGGLQNLTRNWCLLSSKWLLLLEVLKYSQDGRFIKTVWLLISNISSAQVTMGLKETHQDKCTFRITYLLYMGAFGNFCQWICSIQYIRMSSCLTSLKPRMKMTVMLCCCTNTRNSRKCWAEKDLLAVEAVVEDSHFHFSSCLHGVRFHVGLTVKYEISNYNNEEN